MPKRVAVRKPNPVKQMQNQIKTSSTKGIAMNSSFFAGEIKSKKDTKNAGPY